MKPFIFIKPSLTNTLSDFTFVEVEFIFINAVLPEPIRIDGASIIICESEVMYIGPQDDMEEDEFVANVRDPLFDIKVSSAKIVILSEV